MIEHIVNEFTKGIALIEVLDKAAYSNPADGLGSIGAHFRHNLDFASNLLAGLQSGRIDYNQRERNIRVERSPEYAREQMLLLIKDLSGLSRDIFVNPVLVSSEIEEEVWHESTIARELEFLHSHTVHHYALIAEKLKASGSEIDSAFGVAPSTLKFWMEEKSASKGA